MASQESYVSITLNQPFDMKRRGSDGSLVTIDPVNLPQNAYKSRALVSEAHFPTTRTVGRDAFNMCVGLVLVEMPLVHTIGQTAFYGCSALASLDVPLLATIGDGAFGNCTKLSSITCGAFRTIGAEAFKNCTALRELDMPQCTSIGNGAFSGCSVLRTVKAMNTKTIGEQTFSNCVAIKLLTFPYASSVGSKAFLGCQSAEFIDLPSVQRVSSDDYFSGCVSAKYVCLKGLVHTGVQKMMFRDMPELEWVNLSTLVDVTTAEDQNYRPAIGLKQKANIVCRNGMSWGDGSEPDNYKSDKLEYEGSNPNEQEIAGIKSSVEQLESNFFDGCAWGTETDSIFQNRTELAYIFMPHLESIKANTFKGCSELKQARLPSLREIGANAFADCTKLEYLEVNVAKETAQSDAKDAWGVISGCIVSCPNGSFSVE